MQEARVDKIMTVALIAALAALVVALMVLAAVPPVDRDALTHHLAVPKLYLKHGGLVEIPAVPFSYYPMNLDLLYLIPLYFGNDILPKYIHFAFALMTGFLILRYLRRRLENTACALLGALMFLSLPVIVKLSITVYVDLGLIFFSTAALLQLLKWARAGRQPRHLLLAGVFAGLCLGTKPNGLLAVFLMVLCVPFLQRREAAGAEGSVRPHRAPQSVKWTLVFAAVAALIYSPWMIRNAVWTGNPFYPMARSFFGPVHAAAPLPGATADAGDPGATGTPEAERGAGFGHFSVRRLVFGESFAETLAIPVRIFFQGRDDDPRLFDGRLNPYLLAFPLIAFLRLGRGPHPRRSGLDLEMRFMGGFALLYLVFAFFLTDMRIRYVGPIIPPLVILACIGIHDLAGAIRTLRRPALRPAALGGLGLVLAGLLGLNASYLSGQFTTVAPVSYLTGSLSRDEYIQQRRPEYAAITHANRTLPADARILALFIGNRVYYSDREMICSLELFAGMANSAVSAEGFSARLRQAGVSHVLIGVEMFNHWAGRQFGLRERLMLERFFQDDLREVFQQNGYALFEVGQTPPRPPIGDPPKTVQDRST